MADSNTEKPKKQKPPKPRPDFPLFPHISGRWAKKIRGRRYYFGSWADGWQKALEKYESQKEDIEAGRVPRAKQAVELDGLKLGDLFNDFLASMENKVTMGDLKRSTFNDYFRTCKLILEHLGVDRLVSDIRPGDWGKLLAAVSKGKGGPGKKPKPWSHVTRADFVTRTKVPFYWAHESELIPTAMTFGPDFKKPAPDKLNAEKQSKPQKLFSQPEVLALINAAGMPLRAMILLGINAAFGNGDLAALPLSAVDLKTGWIDFPRPKTAVKRRCKLWPETTEALKTWLALRENIPGASESGLVFLREDGRPWGSHTNDNPVSNVFSILVKSLKLQRTGRGFYSLRHTFRTEADPVLDDTAVNMVMGHTSKDMAGNYRHRVDDHRIERVCNHVHDWLYGAEGGDRG